MVSETPQQSEERRSALANSLEQAGITRTACARQAGLDSGTFSKFMTGKRTGLAVESWEKIIALLPGTPIAELLAHIEPTPTVPHSPIDADGYTVLAHADIEPDPGNYRKTFDEEALDQFAEELARDGLLAPLVVRRVDGRYRLIAGERRWRAIGIAIEKGWWPVANAIPCTLRDVDEQEARALSIIENLQRQDVPRMEEAQGLYSLHIDHHLSHDKIAKRLGVSKRYVQQSTNLVTKLGAEGKAALEAGNINFDQARKIWTLPMTAQAAVTEALKRDWSLEDAMEDALCQHPPLKDALFDVETFTGETFKSEGETYAVSAEAFEEAQQQALADTISRLTEKWSEVRTGSAYFNEWEFDRTKEKRKGFAYVRTEHPTTQHPYTRVRVYEGFCIKANKAPGIEPADETGTKPVELTQRQLVDAANIKTIVLQKAIADAPHRVPLAIATNEIFCNLVSGRSYETSPSLLSLERAPRETPARTSLPVWSALLAYIEPLIADGLIAHTDHDASDLDAFPFDWQTRVNRPAIFEHLLAHEELEKIFALCIAVTSGCWPESAPGDDPIAVSIADTTRATLEGSWRMTEAYLTPFTIAGLHRVADVCGHPAASLSGERPRTKKELIDWIMQHPARHSAWLPPELHFGYREDIQADVKAWLMPNIATEAETDEAA
ncbi:MAG: ParB/RepB/Spo0J family partition protein [Parvibaculum sp.]